MARAATAGSGGRLHFSATRANTRRMASRVGAGSDPFWTRACVIMQQRACLLACVGGEDAPITLGADGRQKKVAA